MPIHFLSKTLIKRATCIEREFIGFLFIDLVATFLASIEILCIEITMCIGKNICVNKNQLLECIFVKMITGIHPTNNLPSTSSNHDCNSPKSDQKLTEKKNIFTHNQLLQIKMLAVRINYRHKSQTTTIKPSSFSWISLQHIDNV